MLASGTETLNKCVKHPLVALFARIPFLFTAEIKKIVQPNHVRCER